MYKKHQDRISAETEYQAALYAVKNAENIGEGEYQAASEELDLARRNLVQMEMLHPTAKERKRETDYLYAAIRG